MLTLELALVTHPQATFMPAAYLPDAVRAWLPEQSFHLLPFQILTLARSASITLHIFISQVAPPNADAPIGNGDKVTPQTMKRLADLVRASNNAEAEASRMLQMGLSPFRGDRDSVTALRRGMKDGLILGGVRSSPGVQRAVEEAVQRRDAEGKN